MDASNIDGCLRLVGFSGQFGELQRIVQRVDDVFFTDLDNHGLERNVGTGAQ